MPTLIGALTVTFIVMQFVPGGPVEQILAEARAAQAGSERGALQGGARCRREADRGAEEALRLRQAGARALCRDARQLRALRSRPQLHAQQGRLAAHQGEAAGVDLARAVDLPRLVPDIDSARRREGGARGLALRCADHAGRAGRLRDPGLRAGRAADRAVRRRHVLRLVPAARPHLGQLGRAVVAGAHRRLLLAPHACR